MLITCWSLAFFFAFAFQCGTHPEYWWTSLQTIEQYYNDNAKRDLAFAVSDVVTDLMILGTPVPIVLRLQMGRLERVGLCVIFGLGTL